MTGAKPLRQSRPPTDAEARLTASRFAAADLPPHFSNDKNGRKAAASSGHAQDEPWFSNQFAASRIDEEYLRNYESLYGKHGRAGEAAHWSPARIFLLAALFAVGTALGLAAAWLWSERTAQYSGPFDMRAAQVPQKASRLNNADPRSALRGISAGELPYDGAPPPEASAPHRPASRSIDASSALATASTPPASVKDGREQVAAKDKPSARASGQTSDRSKIARVKSNDMRQKSGVASRAARAREIDRIKRQAEEELKKKTEQREAANVKARHRGRGQPRQMARSADLSRRIRVGLIGCERMTNLISREVCKWRLCNDRWGRHGCPSYAPHAPSY